MKVTMGGLNFVLFVMVTMVLFAGNADAKISMPEREHVQAIVWAGEFVTFLIAVIIAVFVWRLGKRDSKNKKSKRDDS